MISGSRDACIFETHAAIPMARAFSSHGIVEVGREEDDHLAGVLGQHLLGHLEPGEAGHAVVEEDDRRDRRRVEIGEPLQRLGPSSASSTTLNPPRSRKTRASMPHLRLVVHYEDARRDRGLLGDCHGAGHPSSSPGPGRAVRQ